MGAGNTDAGDIFLCGETAFALWQALRTMGRPRLDQRATAPHVLTSLGIRAVRNTASFGPAPSCDNPWLDIASILKDIRHCAVGSGTFSPSRSASREETGVDGPPALPYGSPVEVLVGTDAARRNTPTRTCRVWSRELPRHAFVRLDKGAYLSRPEFVFLQLASRLSLVELVLLGYELCGFYAVRRTGIPHARRCLPLATASGLSRFLAGVAPGARGLGKARRAAKLVTDHAGSVGETATVALLCIARARGGYGIPLPKMNCPAPIPAKLRELLGPHSPICDAYWPKAHFALEYDGRIDHEGADAVARDHVRANRLSSAGVDVEVVTRRELFNPGAFDKTARRVARGIGYKLFSRDFGTEWFRKRAELRDEVLGFLFCKDGKGRDLGRPHPSPFSAMPLDALRSEP